MELNSKGKWWKIVLAFAIIGFFLTYNLTYLLDALLGHVMHVYNTPWWCSAVNTSRNQSDVKTVLLWTPLMHDRDWGFAAGHEAFKSCREQRCQLTTDRCLANMSSAVLFHGCQINTYDLPPTHPHKQVWVFYNRESPVRHIGNHGSLSELQLHVNWTATYHPESDIHIPYTDWIKWVKRLEPPSEQDVMHHNTINWAENKTKGIVWLVSNCDDPYTYIREQYLKELQSYINVDIYGKPGTCDKIPGFKPRIDLCDGSLGQEGSKCFWKYYGHYRYLLAFENAVCDWYISEKIARALNHGILPITLGPPIQQYNTLLPEGSFLYVDNFTSSHELVKHIQKLDANHTLYNSYFTWRVHYELKPRPLQNDKDILQYVWCEVCERLWRVPPVQDKFYNISEFWSGTKQCSNGIHIKK